jgi:demethylmenaquinone methyltransferase / 2-methoxy-6-polyprenyl-1,4-benzoquinol methylase
MSLAGDDPLAGTFGARRVAEDERRALIRSVFAQVAPRYDLMNDLMSFGIHRLWKRAFVRDLPVGPGLAAIDLAGGTGDIARLLKARGIDALIVDPSPEMLAVARALDPAARTQVAEAEGLPFDNASLDLVTISFGIRNVTRMEPALAEIARVLKPGGLFACLEFSTPVAPLRPFYAAWSATAIPLLGAAVSGHIDAYRYLVQSIRRFPDQDTFAGLIGAAGFEDVRWTNLSLGIAAIHTARRV